MLDNPGPFPEGYEPYDFINNSQESILRNPLIVNILYLSKDIEKWASGLKQIYDECKKRDVKLKFEKLKTGFKIVFTRSSLAGTVGKRLGKGLGKNQRTILELMDMDKNITISEISDEIGISTTAVENNISKLKKKGMIKRKDGRKATGR